MSALGSPSQSDCSLLCFLTSSLILAAGSGRKAVETLFNKHPLTHQRYRQHRQPTVYEILKGLLWVHLVTMRNGLWTDVLKIPCQIFGTVTAVVFLSLFNYLLFVSFNILNLFTFRSAGWDYMVWSRNLNFYSKRQNEAFKLILPCRELREPAAF